MEIKDYPNYLIYEDGMVYNKKSYKFLKTGIRRGYVLVYLYNNGNQKMKRVHRLVAEHYIPNPDNKPSVDHIDRNKLNNNIENLRWATCRENSHNRTDQSEYVGVNKSLKKYTAKIVVDGKAKCLGSYATKEEASTAYQKALDEINKGLPISYKKPPTKNKYKYVYQRGDKYIATLTIDGKHKHLGNYATPEDASKAIEFFKSSS